MKFIYELTGLESYMIYSLLLGFTITLVLTPLIVSIAQKNNLLYWPNNRSSHNFPTPALGGIAIYFGFIIPFIFFSCVSLPEKIIIHISLSLIFILGLIDDLQKINPFKKLLIISLLAFLIARIKELTIYNLHGILNIYEMPAWLAVTLTALVIIFIVNAINLLDGIDGLAGGLGIIILGVFSLIFYRFGNEQYLVLNFSMISALSAFLIYNLWSKKYKIFMGDSGSLFLGLVLSITLIRYFKIHGDVADVYFSYSPITVLALFIVPIFDSVHVFFKRVFMRKSPFLPDRNHIHHTYLKLGLSHRMASLVLIFYTLFFFFLSQISLFFLNGYYVILIIIFVALLLWHIPETMIRRNPRKYVMKRKSYKNP